MDQELELHKQHFACYACRKAFKPRGTEEMGAVADREIPCPECGAAMTLMGRDFQASPQRAVKEWQLLELLRSFGVVFEPGHVQPRTQPTSLREVEEFLVRQGYDEAVIRRRLDTLRAERSDEKRPTRAQKKQREGRGKRR